MLRMFFTVSLLCLSSLTSFSRVAQGAESVDGWIVWHRGDRREDARREIWLMKADGTLPSSLTNDGGRQPSWSPGGRWIAYHHYRDDSGHVVRPDGSDDRRICTGRPVFWLDDSQVVCENGATYRRVDALTGIERLLLRTTDLPALEGRYLKLGGVTSDLRYAIGASNRYRRRYKGANGSFKAYHAAVVIDLEEPSRVFAVGAGCEPTLSPSGDTIFHVRADGPHKPDIYSVALEDVLRSDYVAIRDSLSYAPRAAYPDDDWGHEYFPRVSAGDDGAWITYSATTLQIDRSEICHDHELCGYQIFAHRLAGPAGNRIQLTDNQDVNAWAHLWVGELPPIDSTQP